MNLPEKIWSNWPANSARCRPAVRRSDVSIIQSLPNSQLQSRRRLHTQSIADMAVTAIAGSGSEVFSVFEHVLYSAISSISDTATNGLWLVYPVALPDPEDKIGEGN